MKEVCIVTPDLSGPVRNGGIGTQRSWSMRLLKDAGYSVSVFYTGPYEVGDPAYWRDSYLRSGVKFFCIDDFDDVEPALQGWRRNVNISCKVLRFLEDNDFDIVHFDDWQANGFIPIQAKRTGTALRSTVLTTTMHASSRWLREGTFAWPGDIYDDAVLDYCERYCCENADVVISPSEFMFKWALDKGWKLPEDRRLIPNYCEPLPHEGPLGKPDASHLVFFGRLETLKGLDKFISSVDGVLRNNPSKFRKISFLGKLHVHPDGSGYHEDIGAFQEEWPDVDVRLLTDLDSTGAIRYLKETGGIAVMPYLIDNYPYAVLECIQNEIPFVVSKVGGIPETVKTDNRLFEPTVEGLTAVLENIDNIFETEAVFGYSRDAARSGWLDLQESEVDEVLITEPESCPRVSVCIPYFNHGKYLEEILFSLESSEYPDYEVVVVNDGSTDPDSLQVFEQAKERYSGAGWKFFTTSNNGPTSARNFAVGKSTGELLIFMDADNVAEPDMIENFAAGMEFSGADCLTCHFNAFSGSSLTGDSRKEPLYTYTPVGACLEGGIMENIFGDTNFIIKRDVYDRLGGFFKNKGESWEDYLFLSKLCIEGYRLEVLPRVLFWYRHMGNSRSRVSDSYVNRNNVANLYASYLPEKLRFLPAGVMGMHLNNLKLKREVEALLKHIRELDKQSKIIKKGPLKEFLSGLIKATRLNLVERFFRRHIRNPLIELFRGMFKENSGPRKADKGADADPHDRRLDR